ncbi:MAG TPA: hypothetical protein VHU20_05425 [Candidatus Eisenbacteria bacterium]|nr:hypothetical protein [Candidatus Eisenbacteria bacterium]
MTATRVRGPAVLALLLSIAAPALAQAPPGAQPTTGPQTAPPANPVPTDPNAVKPPPPPILTLFTVPRDADVVMKGRTDLAGRTPLDFPVTVEGKYSVRLRGAGYPPVHGVIYVPPRGQLAFVLSEPREGSLTLFMRGFNYPGVPALTSGRTSRGVTLGLAASAGIFMAAKAHSDYRERLDEVGEFPEDRARDERRYRNGWLIFTGGTWALSALDYWTRPRFDLAETTPSRLTLDVPTITRVGAVWRSLLIPGAGQDFSNHRSRGTIWLASVIAAGAGYVITDYRVNRDETDVKWAKIGVDEAGPGTIDEKLLELEQQERDLSASQDARRGFAIAGITLYSLNLLDSMIMPLGYNPPKRAKVASIEPIVDPRMAGMSVNVRF